MRRFWLILVSGLLSACAVKSPPEVARAEMCGFKRHNLQVEVPGSAGAATHGAPGSFAEALQADMRAEAGSGVSDSMLFLSGGSQNGAFGAGFLDGWSKRRTARGAGLQGLPKFKVVTGISTGAILSTWAFINDTGALTRKYALRQESDVLQPFAKPSSTFSTALAVARRGAVADLSPLRRQLRLELTEAVLGAVAQGAEEGRRLYVGAVDVDSGQAVVFDMTDMAQRFVAQRDRRDHLRNCYAEAILASSSVPMAALPAFIDNRMYIDGGARFGLFSDEIGAVIDDQPIVERPAVAGPFFYVLVNGDLKVNPQCRKVAETCPDGTSGGLDGARQDWRFLELAMRSVSILINQVYRSSVERIEGQAGKRAFTPVVEYIRSDMDGFEAELIHPELGAGSRSCAAWKTLDEQLDRPVEFHPRFMQCLIRYGDARAGVTRWHESE